MCSRSLVGSRRPISDICGFGIDIHEYLHQEEFPLSIRSKRSTTRSFAAVIAATLIASLLALVAGPASAVTPLNKSSATSADGRVSGDDLDRKTTRLNSSHW